MNCERPMRGFARRGLAAIMLSVLGSILTASLAHAQVQTFFVVVPSSLQGEEREAYQECAERLNAALVNTGMFRASADAETQRTVSSCIGDTASATAKRECDLSIANVAVDWLMMLSSRQIGGDWKWGAAARSPAEGGAQKWGGDEKPAGVTNRVQAAYEACDVLGKQFACNQGVAQACIGSGLGAGPILGTEAAAPSQGAGPARALPSRARVSALDIFDPEPHVVSVWMDGKEVGTSENQITGVSPGRHEVALKATGYFDYVEQLNFVAGVPSALRRIQLRKTTATLRVEMIEPALATVFISGRERGTTAKLVSGIAPGEAEVVFRAEGYREHVERMNFEAGQDLVRQSIRLEVLPSKLTLTANLVGAEVVVDGTVLGTTTGEADVFEVAPTAKYLEVRRRGYVAFTQRLDLRPGRAASARASLSRAQPSGTAATASASSSEMATCPAGYVRILPGTFTMGFPQRGSGRYVNQDQHQVTITRAYCMKATEVTQGEWLALMGGNPSTFQQCGLACPVEQVSWDDAVLYANALSRREGLPECYVGSGLSGLACRGYRLPTEAEWEYAARAGRKSAGPGNLDSVAWYAENAGGTTSAVGQKQPNAWGLYDMIGNVWEWTGDRFGGYEGAVTDPLGPSSGSSRATRGGSWNCSPDMVRVEVRGSDAPSFRNRYLGFRLVRTESLTSASVEAPAAPDGSVSSGATVGCPAGYVRIAPGAFTMGSPVNEDGGEGVVPHYEDDCEDSETYETPHRVTITRAYCMKATEVTQGEWQSVTGSNPSEFKNCGANCPVEQVSWEDAVGFANALSRREGLPECYSGSILTGLGCRGYRLPTEAEWEYAARAGTTGATDGNLDRVAWYDQNAGGTTHPVRQKQPNAWGLYDMLGNVWEWTGDWYDTYPGPVTDPTGPETGSYRVGRGGSWDSESLSVRAEDRYIGSPNDRIGRIGFRLVRTVP